MPYKTAELHAKLTKNSITVFESKANICERLRQARQYYGILQAIFGIPNGCPITRNQKFCFNNTKITSLSAATSKFLPTFFVDSKIATVKAEITHDTGNSCFEVGFIML